MHLLPAALLNSTADAAMDRAWKERDAGPAVLAKNLAAVDDAVGEHWSMYESAGYTTLMGKLDNAGKLTDVQRSAFKAKEASEDATLAAYTKTVKSHHNWRAAGKAFFGVACGVAIGLLPLGLAFIPAQILAGYACGKFGADGAMGEGKQIAPRVLSYGINDAEADNARFMPEP